MRSRQNAHDLGSAAVQQSQGNTDYAERFRSDPRGGGTPVRPVGSTGRAGEACRDPAVVSARTSRTASVLGERLSVDVVVAPENAWRELPVIISRIIARISCK